MFSRAGWRGSLVLVIGITLDAGLGNTHCQEIHVGKPSLLSFREGRPDAESRPSHAIRQTSDLQSSTHHATDCSVRFKNGPADPIKDSSDFKPGTWHPTEPQPDANTQRRFRLKPECDRIIPSRSPQPRPHLPRIPDAISRPIQNR